MPNREQTSILKGTVALTPRAAIASNTTTVGTVIDTQGYDAVSFFITSGVITDGTYTPLIEECATSGGTYTAVADADLTVTEASIAFVAADDATTKKIGYTGTLQFVRLSLVSTGVTTGGFFAATAILGIPSQAPVA